MTSQGPDLTVTDANSVEAAELYIPVIPPYPDIYSGRGIVICAGGHAYFTSAWITIRQLRRLGCELPIQVWHLGPGELSDQMSELVRELGVECVDGFEVMKTNPIRRLGGFELKPYAMMHCPFKEVLLLDADNLPLLNPEFLFDNSEYLATGAIFWPDHCRLSPKRLIWNACGVEYRDEPEFESGQIVLNKQKCWRPHSLTMWYNEHSYFYYTHIHGDKDTYHMAFRKLDAPYAMAPPVYHFNHIFFQHDFEGNLLFQHGKKWDYYKSETGKGLMFGDECLADLKLLRQNWDGIIQRIPRYDPAAKSLEYAPVVEALTSSVYIYERVGWDQRPIVFLPDGTTGLGYGYCETFWDLVEENSEFVLELWSETELTCRLSREHNDWVGRWEHSDKMPIRLSPTATPDISSPNKYLETFAPWSSKRDGLSACLKQLLSINTETPTIVEIGSIQDGRIPARSSDGWSTCVFGWFAQTYNAEFRTVDRSQSAIDICKRSSRMYSSHIQYHLQDGRAFLESFDKPINLLYIDTGDSGDAEPSDREILFEAALDLNHKPEFIVLNLACSNQNRSLQLSLVSRAISAGYRQVHGKDDLCCLIYKPRLSLAEAQSNRIEPLTIKLSASGFYSGFYEACVCTHDRGNFETVTNSNVLIYWPHGFGDFVFLSLIAPFLNPTNRYWITRFGDDSTSLFEGNDYIRPMYMGNNSPHCDDGGRFGNKHFGIHYDDIDGGEMRLQLPSALLDQCRQNQIDSVFWTWFPETHGHALFPNHSKGRNVLSHIANLSPEKEAVYRRPLTSTINFNTDSWLKQWVEGRLKNVMGFGQRKLCIVTRVGYTSIDKNWGHLWRDELPEGKQEEGQECRLDVSCHGGSIFRWQQ